MRKAETPPLAGGDTLQQGLRLILGEGLAHLEAHRPAARAGEMEAIHQSRVALRRLRAALKLFRPLLAPVACDGFNDQLRTLGQRLGAARDWDVFMEETMPAIAQERPIDSHALQTLSSAAGREREIAHAALAVALDDPRVELMLEDLEDWGKSTAAFDAGGQDGREMSELPLADMQGELLDRLERRVRQRGRGLAEQDDEERHDLRKALKVLRYGLQMFEALHDREGGRIYRKALSALQEDLGHLNDAIAAVELVHRLPPLPGRTPVEFWSSVKKDAALKALPEVWAGFRDLPPFW